MSPPDAVPSVPALLDASRSHMAAGRLAEAHAQALVARDRAATEGDRAGVASAECVLGTVLVAKGRLADADLAATRAAGAVADDRGTLEVLLLRAEIDARRRDAAEASDARSEALELARRVADTGLLLAALLGAARDDARAGRVDRARARLAEARLMLAASGSPRDEQRADAIEVDLAIAADRPEEALALAAAAIGRWTGRAPVGRLWSLAAGVLVDSGRPAEADEAFRRTEEAFPSGSEGNLVARLNRVRVALNAGRTDLRPALGAIRAEATDAGLDRLVAEALAHEAELTETSGEGDPEEPLDALVALRAITGVSPGLAGAMALARAAAAAGSGSRRSRSRAVRELALTVAIRRAQGDAAGLARAEAKLDDLAAAGVDPPVGRWDLVATLGRGAMGAVWLGEARDGSAPAAIKVLAPQIADRALHERLLRAEVRATARLLHRCVARVLAHGEIDEAAARVSGGRLGAGSPWLATERVDGVPASERCGNRPWEDSRRVIEDALAALAHAHARGVLHRDLKPANVLVGHEVAKLVDFGLSGAFADAGGPLRVAGSPSYMAPEQARGDWRATGPATDLYALGMLAAALVQGTPPHDRPTSSETLRAQLEDPLPPIRPRMPVPLDLGRWIARLVQKEPRDRYCSAAEAARALAALGPPVVVDALEVDPPLPPPAPAPAPPLPPDDLADDDGPGPGPELFAARTPAMVGRTAERTVLWEALRAVLEGGGPRAVVVRGVEGIGRSRLLQWLGVATHELDVARVLSVPHGPSTTGLGAAAIELVRGRGLSRDAVAARLRSVLGCAQDDPLPQDLARGEVDGTAGVGLLRALARERPLVLLADDAEWGASTLHAVETVVARPGLAILAVVAVASDRLADRPEQRATIARLIGHPRCRTVELGPLSRTDQRRLLSRQVFVEEGLAGRIVEWSAGSPGLLARLLDDWVSHGRLVAGPRGCRLRAGAPTELPEDLVPTSARTLFAVAGPDADAVRLAALLGPAVHAAEWARAVASAGLAAPTEPLADRLVAAELWAPTARGWSFTVPSAWRAIDADARRCEDADRLHRACADALCEADPRTIVRRAGHLAALGRFGEALDAVIGAAVSTRARLEPASDACEVAERSLSAVAPPADDERRGWVALLAAHRDFANGDRDAGAERTEAAISAARAHGWRTVLPELLRMRGVLLRNVDRYAEARRCFEDALAGFDANGDRQGWRLACLGLARTLETLGEAEESVGLLARLGDDPGAEPGLRANALVSLATHLHNLGRSTEAARIAASAEPLVGSSGDLRFRWLVVRGASLRVGGDLVAAERVLRQALDLAERTRDDPRVAALPLVAVLADAGRFPEAVALVHHVAFAEAGMEYDVRAAIAAVTVDEERGWEDRWARVPEPVLHPDPEILDIVAAGAARALAVGRPDRAARLAAHALAGFERIGRADGAARARALLSTG